ncbi:YheT family hydrolase [Robbsia andropogonis]|uniref:YheT family hydrolase n=1 Tax=Robbsia andropogonis TaxID=28092 RepID=UPI003D2245C3
MSTPAPCRKTPHVSLPPSPAAGVARSTDTTAAFDAATARTAPRPPPWLLGGHAQTIIPSLCLPKAAVPYRRERWTTPDGDFIDLDWADGDAPIPLATSMPNGSPPAAPSFKDKRPLLVLFHGLEGSSDSHYARALASAALRRGWRAVIPHFRSCSGEMNLAPRFYHSGDAAEIDWILDRLAGVLPPGVPMHAAGVSLGGNALLRWLGEQGQSAHRRVRAAAAISAPLDLAAGGHSLAQGFNQIYTRHFLQTLKQKSATKWQQFPRLFALEKMQAAQNLHAFDNIVTAPLHGYRDADDYWHRASSKPVLPAIHVPTLVLNARNDPFLPRWALPGPAEVSRAVTLMQPDRGGHVGFTARGDTTTDSWLARCVLGFLGKHEER